MRIYKLLAASLLTFLMLAVLLTGCDLQTACGELTGKWTAYGGLSLEFINGRFTRTIPGGEVHKGTYTTDNGKITFHIMGSSSETFPYSLNFPLLIVDGTTYYHDSPRIPDDLEGLWFGFRSLWSNFSYVPLVFEPAKPQRGNPNLMEGTYIATGIFKGEYTVTSRQLPNAGVFTMNVTHISGAHVSSFIRFRLAFHLLDLFDWEALEAPNHTGDWWFTHDEARKFFTDAAQKARQRPDGLAVEQHVMNVMNTFFRGMYDLDVYDYTLIEFEDDIYDYWGNYVEGNTLLTLRSEAADIITFVKAEPTGSLMELWNLRMPCKCSLELGASLVLCCETYKVED